MKPVLKYLTACWLLLSFSMPLVAQNDDWRDYLQQLGEDGTNSDQIETMSEELADLEANPFNVNSVTIEELRRIPFLSEDQLESMSDFFTKNRPLYSLYELRNVPLLDVELVKMMLPLFYVGKFEQQKEKNRLGDLLKRGRHEVQLRFDKVFPQRAGYKNMSDSILQRYPNRIYRGEDFYHSLKYSYSAGKMFQAGIVAEKDAGEPFLNGVRKGYDHYGGYVVLNGWGKLRALVLGDYRLSFGQGLVLNNNFSLGKTSTTTAIVRRTSLPRRHASTAESGYFRGAAAAYRLGDITLTAFYSYRPVDGNLSGDSVMTSLKTDGYHRTQLELSRKANVIERVIGANIQFQRDNFQIGTSFLGCEFDKPYQPNFQEYNRFYFRGKTNLNASLDYSYRFRRLLFAGETAISQNGSMAALHALNFYPKQGISLSLLHREYSRSYQALYANAFSDGSNVQNESGWYLGSQFSPLAKLKLSLYADVASFPWLKYGVNSSSRSFDSFIQGNYRLNDRLTFDARYRFRQREANEKYPDSETTSVLAYDLHKLLLQTSKMFSSQCFLKSIFEWNIYKMEHFRSEQGWMFSQLLSWQSLKQFKTELFVGYFHSDSYSVRVYSRERNITNTFYMPSFYGQGWRMALSAKLDVLRDLSIAGKASLTKYLDRDVVGSDLEAINASHRLDVMTYIRWRF